jgi:hypothetical protein
LYFLFLVVLVLVLGIRGYMDGGFSKWGYKIISSFRRWYTLEFGWARTVSLLHVCKYTREYEIDSC